MKRMAGVRVQAVTLDCIEQGIFVIKHQVKCWVILFTGNWIKKNIYIYYSYNFSCYCNIFYPLEYKIFGLFLRKGTTSLYDKAT